MKEPPKNSRAAGLRSDERVKRDENRKSNEEAAFEQQKLLFERERATVLESRDQGGWVFFVVGAYIYQVVCIPFSFSENIPFRTAVPFLAQINSNFN